MIRVSTRLSRNSRVSVPIWVAPLVLLAVGMLWLAMLIVRVIALVCVAVAVFVQSRWHRTRHT